MSSRLCGIPGEKTAIILDMPSATSRIVPPVADGENAFATPVPRATRRSPTGAANHCSSCAEAR